MSDKGIRVNVRAKFIEMLPQRAEIGNTGFRKAVIAWAMDEFSIPLASAATAYNEAFKYAKTQSELTELLAGLGRPEDKKGGRKKKIAETANTTEIAEVAEQSEFSVFRKGDGVLVAEKLSFEDATALVAKAKAAKKAALYWV